MDRTRPHNLTDNLVLFVLAVICGADSFVAVTHFGHLNEGWLRTFLALSHGSLRITRWDGSSRGWIRPGSKKAFGTG